MTPEFATRPSALVVGVGSERGLGAALCRRASAEGGHVIAAGRTRDKLAAVVRSLAGSADAVVMDTTQEDDVLRLFDRAMAPGDGIAPVDLVVYNAGNNRLADFRTLEAAAFERFWRVSCFGGFLVGREVARRLVPLGRGTMIFSGASASLRGRPGHAQFAAAKAGLRMVAQSMAREFGPAGLHVAHVIIDGGIDGVQLRTRLQEPEGARGENGLLNVDAIAEAYWTLHRQHRSAWTHELDLRPFRETF